MSTATLVSLGVILLLIVISLIIAGLLLLRRYVLGLRNKQAQNNAPPAGNPPGGNQPPTNPTPPASTPKKYWQEARFWLMLICVVVTGFGLFTLVSLGIIKANSLPWTTFYGFLTAGTLFVIGLFITKEPLKWLKPIVLLTAVLIGVITFAFSGFGVAIDKKVTNAENCVAHGDCGLRSDDLPIINGGTVYVPQGGFKNFYAVGEVAIQNQIGYCLDVSPRGTFHMRETSDSRIVYIKPKSGMKELATVTSLPASECTK